MRTGSLLWGKAAGVWCSPIWNRGPIWIKLHLHLPLSVCLACNGTDFFFFNRHCNPCGFWPAQLLLSILSRKVFTECQWHVKPPTWRTSDLERSTFRHKVSLASETTQANPSSGRWNYGREIAENFAESGDFHITFGFFYMP